MVPAFSFFTKTNRCTVEFHATRNLSVSFSRREVAIISVVFVLVVFDFVCVVVVVFVPLLSSFFVLVSSIDAVHTFAYCTCK